MENTTINSSLPNLAGLTWRTISLNDLQALVELARICYLADGGLGFLFEPDILKSRYFPDTPGTGIGAFAPDGRLAACASVHISNDSDALKIIIVGLVRPDLRNNGIGKYLMRWSQAQAQSLLEGAPANQQAVYQVATESLTDQADRLYRAFGFEPVFNELVMSRELHLPIPERALAREVSITSWQPDLAEQFFKAYDAAFHDRPGFPGWSAAEWIGRVTENDFKPEWTLLARAGDVPLGFVIGNIDLTTVPPGGYVWQIGVIPAQRRRGLASALMTETMRRMQAAGLASVLLLVHTNNPGAIETYNQLGFVTIGRRARYERIAEQ